VHARSSGLLSCGCRQHGCQGACEIRVLERVAGAFGLLREHPLRARLTASEKKLVETQIKNGAPQLPEHMPLYDLVNAFTTAAHESVPARRACEGSRSAPPAI
jgi:hypothetical protein